MSVRTRLPLRTRHGYKVCTCFATKASTANDRALPAGSQGGLGGLIQYQASGRSYEFLMGIDIALCWFLQWSSGGLLPENGTLVQTPAASGTLGQSPNDGYGILGYVTFNP